jgi:hypothetical protein
MAQAVIAFEEIREGLRGGRGPKAGAGAIGISVAKPCDLRGAGEDEEAEPVFALNDQALEDPAALSGGEDLAAGRIGQAGVHALKPDPDAIHPARQQAGREQEDKQGSPDRLHPQKVRPPAGARMERIRIPHISETNALESWPKIFPRPTRLSHKQRNLARGEAQDERMARGQR